jgi:DNA-binding transcriptional regulator YhcF (GntR family)
MGSYRSVVELVTKRILQGDYAISGLPGERELAVDADVSYMTARKAVQHLIREGLLTRGANGRVEINRQGAGVRHLSIAFVSPTFASADIERWRLELDHAGAGVGARIRPMLYVHWDDPLLLDCLTGFDGVFLVPINEPIPDRLRDRFQSLAHPLVILDEDWSALGLPSITLFPGRFITRLLDHLGTLGGRAIDCINVQPENPVIAGRIARYRSWMAEHAYHGELIHEPVLPYERPLGAGYRAMKRLLEDGRRPAPILLAVTLPAAIGAARALHEHGLEVGADIAIAAINGEGSAAYQVPSLTALEAPDAQAFLKRCLRWMASGGGAWAGPLLMEPREVPLVIRESTANRIAGRRRLR